MCTFRDNRRIGPSYKSYVAPILLSGLGKSGGIERGYTGWQLNGTVILDTAASTVEGAIWYDTSANKLKFYNGAAVETVTSSA
jgi:hypothetical protein